MTVWITADTHFGHKNITGPKVSRWPDGYRIFDSIQQMDEVLLHNINSVVGPNDTLIHLGDFAFGGHDEYLKYRNKIICNDIVFIRGNHDKLSHRELIHVFGKYFDYKEYRHNGEFIVLSHYAMLVWNKSHRGSFMLHGHSHGSLAYPFSSRIKDIGVDTNSYKPYKLDDVLKELSKIKTTTCDHHGDR